MDQTSTGLIDLLKSPGPQPEAWNRFVSFYTGEVLRWARGQGFQEADAEDAAQTILANIRELLKGYRRVPGKSFGGWLFRVTVNECRARRRRTAREGPPPEGRSDPADEPETPAFEALEETEHRRRLLQRAMNLVRHEFPSSTWSAFVALAVEGRRAAEVAPALGVRPGVARLAKHRVLVRLREVVHELLE